MFETVIGLLKAIWMAVAEGIMAVVVWLRDLTVDMVVSCLTAIIEIPSFGPTSSLFTYCGVINKWVPLDTMIMLLVAYTAFLAAFITFKLILKCVPLIG